ncbi:AHH domain-containing protein [Aliikangiella sp. IMCC44359]|uniref:AHH domain-containing protein n=1 Tax=Aliikangiella sp. IMCC44359 TaxID=3459125 RepID=UPI00403B1BA9
MSLPGEAAVNFAIKQFAEKENPTLCDLNHVKAVSQAQERLIEYIAKSQGMSFDQLIKEEHQSERLAKFMTTYGDPRPHSLCACHAIISGKHPAAVPVRAVMAWVKMRIDFPLNGSWLPCNTAAKPHMPKHLKNAVAHSRIHRTGYYRWLSTLIDLTTIKNHKMLVEVLRKVRFQLETSTFPSYVMLPASQLR